MKEMTNELTRGLLKRAEAAQETFEKGERALYRKDGKRIYRDEEHSERLRNLRAERREACTRVLNEAREVALEADQEIENARNRDPLASLTTEELERANARRAFALDASETLDTGGLESRLRSVLAGGDRSEIGAYFVAGSRRRREILDRSRQTARGANTPALNAVLQEMHEALDGGRTSTIVETARLRKEEAFIVEQLAGNLKTGARSYAEAWARRTSEALQ